VHTFGAEPNEPLRIGIIGCGGIMTNHVKGLVGRKENVRIAWLCDVDPAQIERMSQFVTEDFQPSRPKRTAEYEEVCDDPDMHACIIATPHHWHAPIAVRAMQAGQSSSSLTIAAPRDITAKWLQKRLAAYAASQPDLKFALVAADEALDFTEANLDLALRLADGPGEHEGIRLGEATFVTVEAADGGPDGRIEWPGCPHGDKPASIRVADGGLAIEAAANGFGRAVVPLLLAEADLAAGRVRQVGDADASPLSYWLIAPLPQWRQKKVKALVEALVA